MIFRATKTAHWPSGPVFCCDRHCASLERIADAMGLHLAVTHAAPDDAECINCKNEANKPNAMLSGAERPLELELGKRD